MRITDGESCWLGKIFGQPSNSSVTQGKDGSLTMPVDRRHDLDALRASAMLLGIGLHAALSFVPFPWMVQDSRQHELFGLLFVAIHGFRMPLFFVISGFFTAMLCRQKGLAALLKHRAQRVLLPCVLGVLTIVPLLHGLSAWVIANAPKTVAASVPSPPLIDAIRKVDSIRFEQSLADGADVNETDAEFGVRPLTWAALHGNVAAVRRLLELGADVNGTNRDGSTALHSAAWLGQPEIVKALVDQGANPAAKTQQGNSPADVSLADRGTIEYLANLMKFPIRPDDELKSGRAKCRELLPEKARVSSLQFEMLTAVRSRYSAWMKSDVWNVRWSAAKPPIHLIQTSLFDHLWFLWFLCWMVGGFAIVQSLAPRTAVAAVETNNCHEQSMLQRLVLSPIRFCWLLPLTLLPQLLMGTAGPVFGPDTSVGLIPQPHLLLYYGLFFGFGVLYFDANDTGAQVGRRWLMSLLIATTVALPMGLVMMGSPLFGGLAQVSYAWLMSFAAMGLFRRLLTRESKWVRYVSDSSYWLYLAHLPLVIAGQHLIRTWPIPSGIKFLLLCLVVTGLLLASYEWLVRYTWLGALLNGRKQRPA